MKKLLLSLLILICSTLFICCGSKYDNYEESSYCQDAKVEYRSSDYYIVKYSNKYAVIEKLSGGSLSNGTTIRGEFTSRGKKYVILVRNDFEFRVNVLDYNMSYDEAYNYLKRNGY